MLEWVTLSVKQFFPKLKTDFGEIIEACINKTLNMIKLDWHDDKSLCIVLCSKGYPRSNL